MNQQTLSKIVIAACCVVTVLSLASLMSSIQAINEYKAKPSQTVVDAEYVKLQEVERERLRTAPRRNQLAECMSAAFNQFRTVPSDDKSRPDMLAFMQVVCNPTKEPS